MFGGMTARLNGWRRGSRRFRPRSRRLLQGRKDCRILVSWAAHSRSQASYKGHGCRVATSYQDADLAEAIRRKDELYGTMPFLQMAKCKGCVANFLFQSFRYCVEATVTEDTVFKGRHFDRSVILLCVRWYLAYNLSLRNLEEMLAERGISVDHATIHRWVVRYSPELLKRFNARKRAVTGKWYVDESYIKVRGRWMYLYRAIDSNGDTVEFYFSERRDLLAAKRFLRQALKRHGRPERIVIDGSRTNREAILSCDAESRLQDRSRRRLKPIRIRQIQYLNNRIEQDHRAVKRRVRSMLGFKSADSARVIVGGIKLIHMLRKQQAKYACRRQLSLAEQFDLLVA
jgi:putative transposase